MDENYPTNPDDEAQEPTPDNESDEGEETTLVPKSFLGGGDKKPGDICKVQVVRSYEDEVEIRYVKHSEKDQESEPPSDHMEAMDQALGSDVEPSQS